MHLSHTRYSDGVQRRMSLDTVWPSLRPKRSVTKTVLRCRTARSAWDTATFSKRLRLGALSRGNCFPHASASHLVSGRTRSQKDPYFWGPGQISGPSAVRPNSANSSARSLRRQPVWLFTFSSVMFPAHWRSSSMSGRTTVKCITSLGPGWKSLRPHFLRISSTTTVNEY